MQPYTTLEQLIALWSPRVVSDLNLASIGAKNVGVGGGMLATTSHLVNIGLPNKVIFTMTSVAKMVLLGGIDAIIGMDILGLGDFAVTHNGAIRRSHFAAHREGISTSQPNSEG